MRTYKKAHFGAFWYLGGQTKGAKGGGPEYLNAPTTATTSTKTTGRGQILHPRGGGAEREGGVTPLITRGTKTGNKVLSLWKGGKRNGKRRKTNE